MRILFIAMSESIHVVRWLSQLADLGWDLHIYSSTYNIFINPAFKQVTIYKPFYAFQKNIDKSVRIIGFPVYSEFLVRVGNRLIRTFLPFFHRLWLKKLIRELKPDVIHSMEFQSAGYLTYQVKKDFNGVFPPWIATNWGSDIYLYRHDHRHAKKITNVLTSCDYYSCECYRDVKLGKELGLTGKVLPVIPNAGGFDITHLSQLRQNGKVSHRKLIIVKGYHGWAGRALVALEALGLCTKVLSGYTIAFFSVSDVVKKKIGTESHYSDLDIQILHDCSYQEIMKKFGEARIYIGLSISDAISTSLLEAIVMGAFPIQSDTSCADEWITHGRSGFIVPAEDVRACADALKTALMDDNLVEQASQINYQTACDRLDISIIRPQAIRIYESIINDTKSICVHDENM